MGRLGHAQSAIAEARRIRAGEERGRFNFAHAYTERLERGDDPLDVLEAMLGEDQPELFVRSGPEWRNPLEPYLL